MNKIISLILDYSRLLGEYKGTLQAYLWWDIPQELKERIEKDIDRVGAIAVEIPEQAHNPIDGKKLLQDLLLESRETICTNGLRFEGVHVEKLKQVFETHGIKYKTPF